MSYGLDNYVNNKVSDSFLLFFDSFTAKENVVSNSFFFFISALDKMGMDVKKAIGQFFIHFLSVMVYACNQNLWLQPTYFEPHGLAEVKSYVI